MNVKTDQRYLWFVVLLGLWSLPGCYATRLTNKLLFEPGPSLNYGRMSASLGVVRRKNGQLVVLGGSPTEDPFAPLTGVKAMEVLDAPWKRQTWRVHGLSIPYPLAGKLFELPDGRLIAFASIYAFHPDIDEPGNKDSGAVAAVLIDLEKRKLTPLYRPKENKAGQPPLQGGRPDEALLQRAFDSTIQLRDGRIVRVGGRVLYLYAAPSVECSSAGRCRYCQEKKCKPHPQHDYACNLPEDCPSLSGDSEQRYLADIEIYTPPSPKYPKGQVQRFSPKGKRLQMNEGRRNVSLIELNDGRILLSGGTGPRGTGSNQVFDGTYFLHPNTGQLEEGPRMIIGREDHASSLLADGRVLITGGTDQHGSTLNIAEIFDPETNRLSDGPPMSSSREDHQTVRLGDWILLLGGEQNDRSDHILNTGEAYDAQQGILIGPFFLFPKLPDPTYTQDPQGGFAGIDDFAVVPLDTNRAMLLGGQQGLQDEDGEYISPGHASRRTLIVSLPKIEPP